MLIAVFTFVAYLIFSSFRRAEQDQVWVGMAKETAHQLGTPLSSLMAWVGLLEDQGVRKDYLEEMNRDIVRLNTVVDRFSKIGSKPHLKEQNVAAVIESTVEYMKPRVSKKVNLTFEAPNRDLQAALSPPLFSWVWKTSSAMQWTPWTAMEKSKSHFRQERRVECWLLYRIRGREFRKPNERDFPTGLYYQTARVGGWDSRLCKRIIEEYHGGRIEVGDGYGNWRSGFIIIF